MTPFLGWFKSVRPSVVRKRECSCLVRVEGTRLQVLFAKVGVRVLSASKARGSLLSLTRSSPPVQNEEKL